MKLKHKKILKHIDTLVFKKSLYVFKQYENILHLSWASSINNIKNKQQSLHLIHGLNNIQYKQIYIYDVLIDQYLNT